MAENDPYEELRSALGANDYTYAIFLAWNMWLENVQDNKAGRIVDMLLADSTSDTVCAECIKVLDSP